MCACRKSVVSLSARWVVTALQRQPVTMCGPKCGLIGQFAKHSTFRRRTYFRSLSELAEQPGPGVAPTGVGGGDVFDKTPSSLLPPQTSAKHQVSSTTSYVAAAGASYVAGYLGIGQEATGPGMSLLVLTGNQGDLMSCSPRRRGQYVIRASWYNAISG